MFRPRYDPEADRALRLDRRPARYSAGNSPPGGITHHWSLPRLRPRSPEVESSVPLAGAASAPLVLRPGVMTSINLSCGLAEAGLSSGCAGTSGSVTRCLRLASAAADRHPASRKMVRGGPARPPSLSVPLITAPASRMRTPVDRSGLARTRPVAAPQAAGLLVSSAGHRHRHRNQPRHHARLHHHAESPHDHPAGVAA